MGSMSFNTLLCQYDYLRREGLSFADVNIKGLDEKESVDANQNDENGINVQDEPEGDKAYWKKAGEDRVVTFKCICWWVKIPEDGLVIWDGNKPDLPYTWGNMIHTGNGGGLDGGDSCLCGEPVK